MDKTSKLQHRLQTALAQRQFYEAHQILRTIYSRMLPQQQPTNNSNTLMVENNDQQQEQNQKLRELLYSGCLALCEAKEFTSAIDLAELYVEALKRTGQRLDNDGQFDRLTTLFSLLPAHLQSDAALNSHNRADDRRTSLLNKTLDWALKSAEDRAELLQACAQLQRKFADVLDGEGRLEQAERLVRAADWLETEIERRSQPQQSTSSSIASAPDRGQRRGDATMEEEGQQQRDVSDIDLD